MYTMNEMKDTLIYSYRGVAICARDENFQNWTLEIAVVGHSVLPVWPLHVHIKIAKN